ncbi:MAG: hypothetical protein AB1744_07640 [Candidatus Zixiibacteriota bacterium]
MLKPEEKAYCEALVALKRKKYEVAAEQFHKAAPLFEENREFNLLRETTGLLLAVREELAKGQTQGTRESPEVIADG